MVDIHRGRPGRDQRDSVDGAPLIQRLRHSLTSGGCCVLPFWGPDSAGIYFLDRPAGGSMGTYRVDLEGGPPSLVEPGAAVFSSGHELDGKRRPWRYRSHQPQLGGDVVGALPGAHGPIFTSG